MLELIHAHAMPLTTIIAIDPGASGGVARLKDTYPAEAYPMPKTASGLIQLLRTLADEYAPTICYVEKVSSTPQMGVKSAFTFGYGFGLIHAAVLAADLRLEWVTPATWQKHHKLIVRGQKKKVGQSATQKKNANKARAQELFPKMTITHAIADALLIADYGRFQQAMLKAETRLEEA